MLSIIENDKYPLPPIRWKENYSDSFECAEYNLEFNIDDLEKFGKSNILTIEEENSTLKVLKENEGIKE